jgi:fructuronate reductase
MRRLSNLTLPELPKRGIKTPHYDRTSISTGVAHFGPGAFHRVHQAHYFDLALERDPRWGICEIALNSSSVRDALAEQDGLYTLAVLDEQPEMRIIGAAREFLVAKESSDAVIERLADPAIGIVTATITEKGYCLNAQGELDTSHPDVAYDLMHPTTPRTFVGYVAAILRRRRERNVLAPAVVSCDNLTENGTRLRRAVIDFAERVDRESARWIADRVSFPRTMVDSITPATDDGVRTRVDEALGVHDAWPVQRESFCQWVIEDSIAGHGPDWRSLGVTVTSDVRAYEQAKLRLLNGAHSSLAYLGRLAGFETVSEAMSNAAFARFIEQLMSVDIASHVAAPADLDVRGYIRDLLRRFRNRALVHRLEQIAWDGSQKLPFRLLGTVADRLAAGESVARLAFPIAAWFHFVRRKAAAGATLTDPLADVLLATARACTGDAAADTERFLALERVFPSHIARNEEFRRALRSAYDALKNVETPASLASAL